MAERSAGAALVQRVRARVSLAALSAGEGLQRGSELIKLIVQRYWGLILSLCCH